MPESVLTILKFGFLALLYLFLARVVRVVVKEMRAPVPAAPPLAPVAPAAPPPVATKTPKGRGPGRLRIVEPPERAREVLAIDDELTVGRGGGCSLVLGDDAYVSNVHARVFRRDGAVYVEDLGSRNGTLVNGDPIAGPVPLRRGDLVQFGQTLCEAIR